ncbi:hypothetical protein RclHR1_03350010 [Rhizophagus clarus]|uniref:HAT C-terminal dimerisation domain-containing protein n=1 Tax=Rhizophagus clarus TaxID=94130 RepID=A0A2Z6RP21_9GLOM|nr:hypothetical protein RclHR1_03350010 [Rhizophagus clarus]
MLTNDEWDLLRELIPILGPFEEATRYFRGSNYSTHSIMKPLITEIINKLKPDEPNENIININIENLEDVFVWDEDQDNQNNSNNEKNTNGHQKNVDLNRPMQTSGVLKKVKDTLYQAMHFYWKNEREISYLPSILDPRIKKLDFAPHEMEQTLNSLKDKYRKMKLSMSSRSQSTPLPTPAIITTPFLSPTPSSTLYQSTLFIIFNHPSPANNRNELDEYLAIPQIPFNIDPFSWWKINKEKFPILSELARAYLSVSATSTPSERLFSDCGNLMGPKRTRMINKTEAVSELRKAIKKENTQAFANIDAKDIEEENEKLDLSAKTNVSIKEKLGGVELLPFSKLANISIPSQLTNTFILSYTLKSQLRACFKFPDGTEGEHKLYVWLMIEDVASVIWTQGFMLDLPIVMDTSIFIVNISPNQDVIGLTTDSNIDLPSYEDKTCIHVTNANEATRREYISPVLHGVVSCDDDKVKVCPEYELSGSYGRIFNRHKMRHCVKKKNGAVSVKLESENEVELQEYKDYMIKGFILVHEHLRAFLHL